MMTLNGFQGRNQKKFTVQRQSCKTSLAIYFHTKKLFKCIIVEFFFPCQGTASYWFTSSSLMAGADRLRSTGDHVHPHRSKKIIFLILVIRYICYMSNTCRKTLYGVVVRCILIKRYCVGLILVAAHSLIFFLVLKTMVISSTYHIWSKSS